MQGLIGRKLDQTQGFLEDGTRVPLSVVMVKGNLVSQVKTEDKDGYHSIQLAFESKKKTTKPLQGHIKKAGITTTPRFFKEIRLEEAEEFAPGVEVAPEDVFKPGDVVDVQGTSKGKGYAGVVKRHNFRGGPRTHGQSDRERAPGSIGQTTTPGRVYKGKRMAGRMGNETVTIKNLEIIDIVDGVMYIKGLIPGPKGAIVKIQKVGENKKYKPLFKKEDEQVTHEELAQAEVVESTETPQEAPVETAAVDVQAEQKVETAVEEVTTAQEAVETAQETVETPAETVETAEEVKEENGGK